VARAAVGLLMRIASGVSSIARIMQSRLIVNLSIVFAGQKVGIMQVSGKSGASLSCTMIPGTLSTRPAGSNPSTTPSTKRTASPAQAVAACPARLH
jgi:hypothetical protein